MKYLFTKKDHQRKYYLRGKIKDLFETDTRKKQVLVPADKIDEAYSNSAITELCKRFGYNIQTVIM